jgi:catechol 2,3-dioxygenase-like lactoylglutathione lyase family enzyme
MPSLHHIGYWVDDLESAQARWQQDLGVGPFQVIAHVPFDTFACAFDGAAADPSERDLPGMVPFDHSAAFAAWGPVVVELDQVHAIDERLAAAYGVAPGAVSHVSWMVQDLAAESARLERLGCRLISTARSGVIAVAWHHGGPLFPHPIEVHERNEVIAGMHDHLAALRTAGSG